MKSLLKNFDSFNHLITELKSDLILGISESRIVKSQSLNINVSLKNYVIEQTSTESTEGGALLYIYNKHSNNILTINILTKLVLASPFIKHKNLNLFLLKLFCRKKVMNLCLEFVFSGFATCRL